MAKSDPTQNIVSELKSLNETNKSLKDKILESINKNASSAHADAEKIRVDINNLLSNLTDAFSKLNTAVTDISDLIINGMSKPNAEAAALLPWERKKYLAIAKIFDNIFNKTKIKPNLVETKVENNDLLSQESTAGLLSKKIPDISLSLEKIYKILVKTELNRIEDRKDSERANNFKEINERIESKKPESQKKDSNSLIDFIEKIPLIGNLFKTLRGLGTMLLAASPVIAVLSHLLSDEIKPWQGAVDLIAKLKLGGGKTMSQITELLVEKVKTIIQWPFKFLKEKMPIFFKNLKIPFAEASEALAKTAAGSVDDLAKIGSKSGFLGKLLGWGKLGLAGAKRLPVIGSLLSLYFAYDRYKKGDYVGMLLEFANVVVSAIPVAGTAISIGIGVIQAIRDWNLSDEDNMQFKINDQKGFGSWLADGIGDIFKSIGDWFSDIFDSMVNFAKDTYNEIKEFFGFTTESSKLPKPPPLRGGRVSGVTPKINLNNKSKSIPNLPIDEKKITKNNDKSIENTLSNADQSNIKFNNPIKAENKSNEVNKDVNSAGSPYKPQSLPTASPPTTMLSVPSNKKEDGGDKKITEAVNIQTEVIAGLLTKILQKETEPSNINTYVSNKNMIDNDVSVRNNISDSRRNYLNHTQSTTNLLRA